jgi:Xaa-Pro dipeptidase
MMLERIRHLKAQTTREHLAALAVMPGANLFYLLGLTLHSRKRLALAVVPCDEQPICLVLPAIEHASARSTLESLPLTVEWFPWSDAEGPAGALRAALEVALPGLATPPTPDEQATEVPVSFSVGVEYTTMRVMELRALEQAVEAISGRAAVLQIRDATPLIAHQRMVKDEHELAAMSEAVRIIETALQRLLPQIKPGVTERQLARTWSHLMMDAGAEGESFAPIVASGPNSANPHHTCSERAFCAGDLIILDAGVYSHGYASDITRTIALGEPGATARHIYELVRTANIAARNSVQPGVSGAAIDRAARKVITDGGYGDAFLHRTGHGLGLECHEPPYLVAGEESPLPVGTTFTIEPGIYLEGLGGVRIEDDVVITEHGCLSLTRTERELMVLPV